jgi:CMP-N,N'-diacetyllegionaminic acid synthase
LRILGIIPARGGSKGIKNKNIKNLNGKPLISYTSEIALKSTFLDKVIVSTDDPSIAEISQKLGLEVPFVRPKNLAADNSSTLSVVQHALNFFKKNGIEFDAVCLLQVTSPLRTINFLENCLKTFILNESDSLISVLKVPHHYNPHWVFEANTLGNLLISTGEKNIITRRQNLPDTFVRDGSVYITKASILLNSNSLYGDTINYCINPVDEYINIDTMDDWSKAESYFENNSLKAS